MADSAAKPGPQSIAKTLETLIHSQSEDEIRRAASHAALTEDLAKALLKRRDLTGSVLQELARNTAAMKFRSVIAGVVAHPHSPRFVSLPLSRQLFVFEQMNVASQPGVPVEMKMALEQAIIDRIDTVSLGERLTLAKLGSTRVAEALLCDPEARVLELALNNSHLTEANVVRTLMRDPVDQRFVQAVARHSKWSLRTDVRCALLRNPGTPMAVALKIAQVLPADVARDALYSSNLPHSVKTYLMAEIQH